MLDSYPVHFTFCLTRHTWYEYLEPLGMTDLQTSVSLLLQPSLACFQHVDVPGMPLNPPFINAHIYSHLISNTSFVINSLSVSLFGFSFEYKYQCNSIIIYLAYFIINLYHSDLWNFIWLDCTIFCVCTSNRHGCHFKKW